VTEPKNISWDSVSRSRAATIELLSSLAGRWRGHLDYLDFQDDQTVSRLPVSLNIAPSDQRPASLAFEYVFDEPGGQRRRSADLVTAVPEKEIIRIDGSDWWVLTLEQYPKTSGFRLVVEREGSDNNRTATLQTIVDFCGETLGFSKTVKYGPTDAPFVRNSFSLVRAP
jgi:hypothetical protein